MFLSEPQKSLHRLNLFVLYAKCVHSCTGTPDNENTLDLCTAWHNMS